MVLKVGFDALINKFLGFNSRIRFYYFAMTFDVGVQRRFPIKFVKDGIDFFTFCYKSMLWKIPKYNQIMV